MSDFFRKDPLFAQRMFSCAGFYSAKLDGSWGPKTEAAQQLFDQFFKNTAKDMGTFDDRTESVIYTLLPATQTKAREFMTVAKTTPLVEKLLSGTRSYAEQDALFAKRPKVTNARGGQSNHNFGIAWDVGVFFDNGKYDEGRNAAENKPYIDLAKLVKSKISGLEWGGDWKSLTDLPHYQLATGKSVSEVRALFEAGKPFVKG